LIAFRSATLKETPPYLIMVVFFFVLFADIKV
jgi:hypothetical protein